MVIGNYGSGMLEVKVARSTVTPVVYTDLSAGTIRLMSKEDAMLGKKSSERAGETTVRRRGEPPTIY